MKKFLPFSLLLLVFTAVATAATLTEQTAQLCKNGDYPAIVELARPLAEQGNPEAQSILGLCYGCGLGAEFDCATAFNWYLKAAEQGFPWAQNRVGVCCMEGRGVPVCASDGLKWLSKSRPCRKLAEKEFRELSGDDSPPAYPEKLRAFLALEELGKLMEKAAGDGRCSNLDCFHCGLKDHSLKTLKIRQAAADEGNAAAQLNLGLLYAYSYNDNAADKQKAIKYLTMAAERGVAEAQYMLGVLYDETDHETAAKWHLKAAENGHPESQYALGVKYLQGNGVEQNSEAALKWWELAADGGSMWAALKIAEYYYEHGNLEEAEKWRGKLSPKISSSQFLMGELYMEEQNRAEAVKWYRKAALTGNLNAQSRLTELDETW